MSTNISWADETINPVVGCSKISEGCRNCYAEKMAWRLKCMDHPQYQDVVDKNGWTGKLGIDLGVFDKLPKKKAKKVFVCSMSDLFHENITDKQIDSVFTQMAYDQCSPLAGLFNKRLHTFLLLTKRPERILTGHPEFFARWPDIWLGVTAENQKRYDERWTIASQIPAAVKFVSIEPALEYVNIDIFAPWPDWVIWGPETGPGKRPFLDWWAEETYELCQLKGIPFFDKRKKPLAKEFPK